MNTEQEKTALQKVEAILKRFWMDKKKSRLIKARHTEVLVEPRVFVGGHVNPEISKLLIQEYLAKITVEDIARGGVIITSDRIMIYDDSRKLTAEVGGKKIIDSMINKITDFLGRELSAKTSRDGDRYVEPRQEGAYSFGDIKGALIEFLHDMEKNDSKNLVRDAIILLGTQKPSVEVQSKVAEVKKEVPQITRLSRPAAKPLS